MQSVRRVFRSYSFWLPTAILITVASIQKYLIYAHHLDPWLVGGFSMFATVDNYRYRAAQISCLHENGATSDCKFLLSPGQSKQLKRLRNFPSKKNLEAFARRCLKNAEETNRPDIIGVRVAINTIEFDAGGPSISRRLLGEAGVRK